MIMNPTAIKHVVVDGHSLTLESFVAIARYNATVELAPSALEAMQKSRALAEKIAAEGRGRRPLQRLDLDRRRGPRGLRHHHRLR